MSLAIDDLCLAVSRESDNEPSPDEESSRDWSTFDPFEKGPKDKQYWNACKFFFIFLIVFFAMAGPGIKRRHQERIKEKSVINNGI